MLRGALRVFMPELPQAICVAPLYERGKMKFSALYRVGHSNFQGDFCSESEFDEWFDCNGGVVWAHLVEVQTGLHVKSIHRPILDRSER